MSLFERLRGEALPVEGHLPGFDRATGWLNSEPLTADDVANAPSDSTIAPDNEKN